LDQRHFLGGVGRSPKINNDYFTITGQIMKTYIMLISQSQSQWFITKSSSWINFIAWFSVVQFGASIDQDLANVIISMFSCQMKGRISTIIDQIDIGTANQEQVYCGFVLLPDGVVESAESLSHWLVDLE
jgi:hypothetical protein